MRSAPHRPHGSGKRAVEVASPLSDRDELFATVDGRTVSVKGRTWRIEIAGIHADEHSYWVQLSAVDGRDRHDATLRVDRSGARDLLKQTRRWIRQLPATASPATSD